MAKIKKYNVLGMFEKDPTGTTLIIQGKKRSGKSHLISIFAKLLIRMGFYIITNFQFTNKTLKDHEGIIYYVGSARGLLKAYTEIPEGRNICLILDDFQAVEGSKSTQQTGKAGDKFQDFSIFQGKIRVSSIYITHLNYHSQAYTNQDPRYIFKIDKPFFYWTGPKFYDIRDKSIIRKKGVKIPVPKIDPLPYEHEDIGFFIFDVDFKDLWAFMHKFRGQGKTNKQIIREYLAMDQETRDIERLKGLTWEDIALAIALKKPGVRGKDTLYNAIPRTALYPALKRVKELNDK